MDYFSFDLQLFSEPTFPAAGTYLITNNDGTIGASVDPDNISYTTNAYYLVIAGDGGAYTATVNKASDTSTIAPADLGITFGSLVISTALTAGTWTFVGLGEKTAKISGVPTGVTFAGLTSGSTVTMANSATGTCTVNDTTFTAITAAATSSVVFTVGATTSVVSAKVGAENETVTVAKSGVTLNVGTAAYTTDSDTTTTITYKGTNEGTLSAGSVTVGESTAITASTAAITVGADSEVTVASDGKVTGLATAGESITVGSSTYTAAASGILLGGDKVGFYEVTPATATVDAKDKKVLSGTNEIGVAPVTLTLALASAATKEGGTTTYTYYALKDDGTVGTSPVADATTNTFPALTTGVIGYFRVETTFDGSNESNNATAVITFKDGSVGSVEAYSGEITVNAAAIKDVTYTPTAGTPVVTKQVKTITVSGISGAKNDDSDVTVNGLAIGTAVTGTKAKTNYDNGGSYTWAFRTITLDAADVTNNKTQYYAVTFDQGAGTITLEAKTETEPTSGSYFKIVHEKGTTSKAGSVKIDYVKGEDDPNLYNLTDSTGAAMGAIFNATAIAYVESGKAGNGVSSIDFLGTMSGNVNNVVVNGIKPGITLTDGGTAIDKGTTVTTNSVVKLGTYAYGYTNAIEIDASAITIPDGATEPVSVRKYITLTTNETTRVATLGTSDSAGEKDYGYYTVTKSVDGTTVTVTFTEGTETPAGMFTTIDNTLTKINLGGDTDVTTVHMTDNDMVTNASKNFTTWSRPSTASGADQSAGNSDNTYYTYASTSAFAGEIAFDNIATQGDDATATMDYYYEVGSATVKGVKTYTITTSARGTKITDTAKNYFKASYDVNTGAITLTYVAATSGTDIITASALAEALAAAKETIAVDGSTVVTTGEHITKKLTLTETIPCNVTDLPKTVKTVDTKDVTGSDYAYKDTYNVTTTIALGKTNQTQWYRVVVGTPGSKANYGVNTATLATAVTTEPTAAQLAANNYVKVTTEGNGSTISIQYLPATTAANAYDFNGQQVTVDPTGAAADATISLVGTSDANNYDNAEFVIKNLTKGQTVTPDGSGVTQYPSDGTEYQTSYALSYDNTAAQIADNSITLTDKTDGTAYYFIVTEQTPAVKGVVTYKVEQVADAATVASKKSDAATAGVKFGAITVTNGTAKGITVSYDGDDISGIGEKIAIDASGAADTVMAIDLSNTGSTINYAVKDMKSGVEVVNPGTNDTYAKLTAVDLTSQTLKLGTDAKAFWTIAADGTLTKTTTEPTDGETNYFSVTMENNAYTVKYVEAGNGTAFDLTKTTLKVDASGVATNDSVKINLSNGTPVVAYNVTGAPAGVELVAAGIGAKDTISYASTFTTWPTTKGTWTYFTATEDTAGKGIKELTVPASAVTIAPEATAVDQKTYNKFTITVSGDSAPYTYKIELDGVKQSANGVLTKGQTTVLAKITVPASYKNIDATALTKAGLTLAGVDDGDTVTVNATSLASLTISGTGAFTVKNTADAENPVTYKASTGTISVKNGKCISGVFALAADEELTANDNANGASVTVTGESAAVAVTFGTGTDEGKIMKITGLGVDETVVVKNSDNTSTTYTYNGTLVTRVKKDAGGAVTETKVAGADSDAVDIANLDYDDPAPALTSSTFKWNTGTYYVSYTGTAATIEKPATESTVTVGSGSYIEAEITDQATGALTLTPKTGTRAGTLEPNGDFAGTITVNAQTTIPVTYTKGANDKFTVAFTNVQDKSKFTKLGTGDKVTTAALKQGESVTLNDGSNDAIYTAAADSSTLVFEDGRIVSGTVTLTSTSGTLLGANGETIAAASGSSVTVTFENGVVKTVTNVGGTDNGAITLKKYTKDADGKYTYTAAYVSSTETYKATSDTAIDKTVVKANGDTENSKLTIVKDADILTGTEKLYSVKTYLNMTADGTAYIDASSGTATIGHATSGADKVFTESDKGKQYVRVTLTKGTPDVVEMTALIYKNGELTTVGADASKIKVIYNASNTGLIKYDGSNDSFKSIKFTGVAADSVFTGLSKGDVVETAALANAGDSVTVNGTEYKALADSAAFTIYAENSRTTYIVDGELDVTGEVISVDVDDPTTKKYTLNYSTSSTAATGGVGNNGVHVAYADGLPTITDLTDGEKVTILNAATNKTTTFERKSTYLYVTTENGTVFGKGPDEAVPAYKADVTTFEGTLTSYTNLTDKAAVEGQFLWSDTATKTATGYFLLSGTDTAKSATVADQGAKTSLTYRNAGEVYLVASVTTGGALTLTTQTMGYDGSLAAAAALTNTQSVTVEGIGGKKITYTRGNEKALTLSGIGAGSSIGIGSTTVAQRANDVITTAALKTTTYKTDGSVDKQAETVTIYGKTYTAAADGVMSFQGDSATAGTFLLNTANATMSTTVTDSDGNVTTMTVTYDKHTYTGATANQNIAVTVSNGRITGVTGLDASSSTTGEQVKVVTTTTDKFGTAKNTTTFYTAAESTETGKAGQVVVTRSVYNVVQATDDGTGTKSTHTFANAKQNIMDSTAVWETSSYVTTQDFDWTKTGYFAATLVTDKTDNDYNKYKATILQQGGTTSIPADYTEGQIFLKVEATKATASSPSVISKVSLVKMNANGSLSELTNATIGTVTINATGSAGGFELPTHTNKVIITNAVNKAAYSGLNAEDTIAAPAPNPAAATTYTVNGTKYNLTAASAGFAMNGAGELTTGTFTITGTATGSGKPVHDGDNHPTVDGTVRRGRLIKSIVYTAGTDNKDGVNVTFDHGHISGVSDLEPGEKAVLTMVKGTAQTTAQTITLSKDDDNVVTQKIEFAGISTALEMTKTVNTATQNDLAVAGYTVSNKFDFGATEAGKIGLFAVAGSASSIETQSAGLSLVADTDYVLVSASQSSKNVTINSLAFVHSNNDGYGTLDPAKVNTALANGVTIAAPTDGNLTLANGAEQLFTVYKWDADKKAYVEDTSANGSEKSRTYSLKVTGAVAGKSYSNFGEKDTVTGPLVTGDKITVSGKELTLAGDNAILIRGDGKAINGVYTLGTGFDSAANITAAEANQFTAKITGPATAIVKVADGAVDSITGISTANSSVTIAQTNTKTGAVTTTVYTVTAVDSTTGDMTVKREVTSDGVTTTATGTAGKNDSITAASWGAPTATLTSKFDWTSASGSGYFLTEVTDTSKKLGTVEVGPATTTAAVGKYYLKVALSADGVVSGLSLHKIKADGAPDSDVITSVTEGTINVTAPTATALTLNMASAPTAVVFNVTGAAAKSVITMDNAKDTLATASLAAGDVVTVNGKNVVSSGGALEFEGTNGALKNGAIQFTKDTAVADLAITTTKATIAVDGDSTTGGTQKIAGTEVPKVTVKDGVVTTITGNTAATVAVHDTTSDITTTYGANMATATFALTAQSVGKDITTVALAKDAQLTGGGLNDFKVAEAGALTLHAQSAAQFYVYEGTLKFNTGAANTVKRLYVTGKDTSVTTDDLTATFTSGSASDVTVEVKNGVLASVKGLSKGDVLVYDGNTYTAVSATVITKEYTDASGTAHKDTAYLAAAGGDILGASYAVVSDDDITGSEAYEGQFSWADVSGRSTGYFKITENAKKGNTATIVEQTVKSSPTAGKNATVKYVKANTATDPDATDAAGNAITRQILTIGALQVTNTNGVTKVSETDAAKILTAGTKITVTAPTAAVNGVIPAVSYTKAYTDKYNVIVNKAADQSVIAGLTSGDKVTTAILAAPVTNATTGVTTYQGVTMTNGKGEAINYVAAAKGALEFLGEGASNETAADSTNTATLVKGTILLDTLAANENGANKTAILAGSADGTGTDIALALDDSGTTGGEGTATDKVVITVAKGVVTSITGLNTKGNKLTLTPTGGTAVTYEVLNIEPAYDAKGNAIANTRTVMVSRTEGSTTYYASFTAGKNIYGELNAKGAMTNGYKTVAADTPTLTDKLWSETDKKGQVVYAEIVDDGAGNVTANFAQAATDAIKAAEATRGKKYLAMTVKTLNGVSTIQKIEVAEVDANGAMKIMTNVAPNAATIGVTGVTINGTNGTNFAKMNYTIPTTVPVTITNAAIGSVITGIKDHSYNATYWTKTDGDQVSTAATEGYTLAKGAVTLYKVVDADVDYDNNGTADTTAKQTIETKVTYAFKAKGDSAKINWDGTTVSSLTNLETVGESVTIAENTLTGVKTTVYEVKTVSKVAYVYKTVTDVDGTKKVYTCTVPSDAASYNWVADPADGTAYLKLAETEVVSDFDWTMDKRDTGYFVVDAKNAAAVKAQTKPVTYKVTTAKDAAATYIAMKVSETGVVESVRAVKFDTATDSATYGEMIDATSQFSGVVNIAAPAKHTLTFDRSKVDTTTTIAETATMAVTGAITGSKITNLALGDTVTTAKFVKPAYNAKTAVWTSNVVTVGVADDANGAKTYKAGAAGALSFKVQEIDGSNKLSLTGGTVYLGIGEYVYAGDRMITILGDNTLPGAVDRTHINVTASTTKAGVTSYTISDLKEGEAFTVQTFGSGATTKTYYRSANNLFCTISKGTDEPTTAVYELKAGTSVKSSVLELADSAGATATKKNPWVAYTESNATFKETADDGLQLTSTAKNAAVTADLKLLDKRIATDNNLYKTDMKVQNWKTYGTDSNYSFVIDKYLANPAKFNGAASVINDDNLLNRAALGTSASDVQQVIGTATAATKVYTAAGINVGQAIKAANGWNVTGSLQNDTITGAASGTDTLNGGAKNDSLVGGGAKDTFEVGVGQDTVKGYATGKDTITYLGDALNVSLTSADVLLYGDTDADGDNVADNSVLLQNMGTKKAVSISTDGGATYVNYYFGSGKATKAESFTFDVTSAAQAAASKYFGKEGLANTLSVGTDKTKATAKTLGDTLEINLSDTSRYVNIASADASKSGNKVVLTATASGSTLKGGTYQTTMKGGLGSDSMVGGKGADTFWFESLDGSDTIASYTAKNDTLYVKDANIVFSAADAAAGNVVLSASGANVVIADADGKNQVTLTKAASATAAINIMTDAVTKNTLSYYVGATNSKKANTFTSTLGKDMAVDKDADGKELTTISLQSYYVGSDTKLDDTLKLASGKTVVTGKKLNLNDVAGNLSSIDIIDTSGLAKGSSIELIGRESGTYTLKGSNNVTENFNLSALKDEKTAGVTNYVTITNLAVADVITLGDNIVATKTSGASSKNTYFTLTDKNDSKTSYGTLCVTGVKASSFTSSSYSGTIKRS